MFRHRREFVNKLLHIFIMEYYSAIENYNIYTHTHTKSDDRKMPIVKKQYRDSYVSNFGKTIFIHVYVCL